MSTGHAPYPPFNPHHAPNFPGPFNPPNLPSNQNNFNMPTYPQNGLQPFNGGNQADVHSGNSQPLDPSTVLNNENTNSANTEQTIGTQFNIASTPPSTVQTTNDNNAFYNNGKLFSITTFEHTKSIIKHLHNHNENLKINSNQQYSQTNHFHVIQIGMNGNDQFMPQIPSTENSYNFDRDAPNNNGDQSPILPDATSQPTTLPDTGMMYDIDIRFGDNTEKPINQTIS